MRAALLCCRGQAVCSRWELGLRCFAQIRVLVVLGRKKSLRGSPWLWLGKAGAGRVMPQSIIGIPKQGWVMLPASPISEARPSGLSMALPILGGVNVVMPW